MNDGEKSVQRESYRGTMSIEETSIDFIMEVTVG